MGTVSCKPVSYELKEAPKSIQWSHWIIPLAFDCLDVASVYRKIGQPGILVIVIVFCQILPLIVNPCLIMIFCRPTPATPSTPQSKTGITCPVCMETDAAVSVNLF